MRSFLTLLTLLALFSPLALTGCGGGDGAAPAEESATTELAPEEEASERALSEGRVE